MAEDNRAAGQEPGRVPDPAALADRAEIAGIIALHCRGVDRSDEAKPKSCHWPEATPAHGTDSYTHLPLPTRAKQ